MRLGGEEGVEDAVMRRGDTWASWDDWRHLVGWGSMWGWWEDGEDGEDWRDCTKLPRSFSNRVFIQPGSPGMLKIS